MGFLGILSKRSNSNLCATPKTYVVPSVGEKRFVVAALDLGIKAATPRMLAQRGVEVHVMPHDSTFEDIQAVHPDGVFLSNGPGDPATMTETIELVRQVLGAQIPIFGICFGHQILGRALGFETYKLQFGHRGINQPVIDKNTQKVEITAHNHGFALKAPTDAQFTTVYGPGEVTHVCLNDGVVEGLQLLEGAAFSVQYHPEAAAGPHDAAYSTVGYGESDYADLDIAPIGAVKSQFFVRLHVADKSGVLASIAQTFASENVSIQTVRQAGLGEDAELIVVTHAASEDALDACVEKLKKMDIVSKVESVIRVEGAPA